MDPRSFRASGSDGLELRLLEWSREGIPMLLVHGFGNEAHIWDDFAPAVAGYYRVLAVDLRGHGDSDWDPKKRYDTSNHAADLEAVIDELDFDRVVLVGHSLGGRTCMLYAGAHPEKVAGFVIVDSAPELDARGTTRIRMEVAEHRDPAFKSIAEYENLLAHNYPAATPEAVKRMAKYGVKQREDGRFVLKMDTAFRGAGTKMPSAEEMAEYNKRTTAELWDALGKITCPTLVVRGAASDVMSPEVADKMVDEVLVNGKLAIVGQAGHSVMTDNPPAFQEAVAGFVLGE